LIVDYLQLVRPASSKDSRVNEVSEITQGLKAIAKELDIPVIALSQLSRQVENREDKRPQLSDLRESGSIEQDADIVMFVYRGEYYKEREKPNDHEIEKMAAWQAEMEELHGKAEIIIGKQRHGPIGTIDLSFEGQFTRFGNLAKPWQTQSQDDGF
ncbi:MAG: replicative DNA helicase, partial [Paracoccaceae bacterium]|nr:replicative DNA helicase [Paracoccaceae bacterium]